FGAIWLAPSCSPPAAYDTGSAGLPGAVLSAVGFNVETTGQRVTFESTSAFCTAVADALAGDGVLRMIITNNDESNLGTHDFARFCDETASSSEERPELRISYLTAPPQGSVLVIR
ncbi:MAG: hypothetical protein PF483_11415, partial [Halothiobacillus sp.]|nr:hypothetical protein [Halothiobacillus sp.]